MHHIQQNTDLNERAKRFVGKTVRDTYNQVGEVISAVPRNTGEIALLVKFPGDEGFYTTDNEHATIVSLGDYGPEYQINPLNRGELEEN